MNELEKNILREVAYGSNEHYLVQELLKICYHNICDRMYRRSFDKDLYNKRKQELKNAVDLLNEVNRMN